MIAWAAKALGVLALAGTLVTPAASDTSDLVSTTAFRVCADPSNLPFSNKAGEGYENKIAEMLAGKLGVPIQYTWFPQATGFVRQTLKANRCDVIISYAQGHELVLNTNHYYVSSYVFVTKADGPLAGVDHVGDPILKGRPLGVIAGSPPSSHMVRNGLIGQAKPYRLVVDRRHESPSEDMIADLENGEIEGAFMWGPIAGFFARDAETDFKITPLLKEEGAPRMFFRVTMGVRQGEIRWKRQLNSLLRRHKDEIDAILTEYGVPIVDTFGGTVGQ